MRLPPLRPTGHLPIGSPPQVGAISAGDLGACTRGGAIPVSPVRFLIICSLLWVLGPGSLLGEQSRFPKPGNVVVLCGIAGDAEHEKSYEEIQTGILNSLATQGPRTGRVFLLSELTGPLPAGLNVERRSPTRADFLALAPELKGNPLTVFVWGHAGTLKDAPVFHVRGPRLTPGDLKNVAESTGGPSEWVLMFCGSGDFARGVQSETRHVLASEAGTRFSSDPLGMGWVARSMGNASSLQDLGVTVGSAIRRLYEERHLVRVEESALWTGTEVPAKLISEDAPALDPGKPANPVAGAGQAPDWTTIARAQPEDYPEEDGVILKRRVAYVLGEATAITEEHEEVIQILLAEGKRLGDFNVSFSPPDETLDFEACEVFGPDGKLQKLQESAIREVNQKAMAEYGTPSHKIFSLPGVVPGALLHVRYKQTWKRFPLPHISLEIPLSDTIPALATEVEVRVGPRSAFHFALRGLNGPNPKIESRDYSQIYRWEFAKLAGARHESLLAPESEPALMISTFPDWADFSGWYRRLIKLADAPTPEIKARAEDLTRAAKTDLERARALYNFVTSLRYVAVPMGVNSHRPHAAANVLANGYGDCKDKANLFNTLLRSVGIEADLVLVPRFAQAFPETPGLAFNHAISRVRLKGGTVIWADTTDDVCRFGFLPPGDPGRNVLVIDEKTQALTPLPAGKPGDHRLELKQHIELGADRSMASLEGLGEGFFDYQWRSAARAVSNSRGAVPALAHLLASRTGDFRLLKQSSTAVSDLGQAFAWRASGEYLGLITGLPGNGGRMLQAPLQMPGEWAGAIPRRVHPLYLNQGYPGQITQTVEFLLPEGTEVKELPALAQSGSGQDGPLVWRLEWKRAGATKIEVRCDIAWPRGELSAKETDLFQLELARLRAAANTPALLGAGN